MSFMTRFDARLWTDKNFNDLSHIHKLIYLSLITHPYISPIGIIRTSLAGMAAEQRTTITKLRRVLDDLSSDGWIIFDNEMHTIAITQYVKWNPPANPNVLKGFLTHLQNFSFFIIKYNYLEIIKETLSKGFGNGFESVSKEFKKSVSYCNENGFKKSLGSKVEEVLKTDDENKVYNNNNIYIYNIKEKENKIKEKESRGTSVLNFTTDVEKIFAFWKTQTKHPRAKLDAKRKQTIANALKVGYSVTELQEAIQGCLYDPWYQGANERGKVYDSIELILRNSDKIETHRRFYHDSITGKASTRITTYQHQQPKPKPGNILTNLRSGRK